MHIWPTVCFLNIILFCFCTSLWHVSDRLIAGLWNWIPHLEMYMELLVSYNGPRAASSMCFPGVERWLLWIGPSPSAVHGAKLNQSRCQRVTAGILNAYGARPKKKPCWWDVWSKYYLSPHYSRWSGWFIGWWLRKDVRSGYGVRILNGSKDSKTIHTLSSGDGDVFPCHPMGLCSFSQNVSNFKCGKWKKKTEHHLLTLETLTYVGETCSSSVLIQQIF